MRLVYLLLCCHLGATELIDRIAVSVGTNVITESELIEQMRLRALLEDTPLRLDADSKRDAADRLIQQALIRREIDTTRYVQPNLTEANNLLASFKNSRYANDEARYQAALRDAHLTPAELLAGFQWQVTVLRFIEYRFRPGVQVGAEDIREYYERKFLPAWRERPAEAAPSLEASAEKIEEILVQERIDNQLDRWISLTRTQVSVRYREEVFAGS